jgi:hypothetical protein
MIPLVQNNPAFSVAILPVDGRLEQKPGAKDGTSEINAIKVGDAVKGDIVNSKDSVEGKVLQINRANSEVASYKILTKDGEEVLIDPTTAEKYANHGQSDEVVGGVDANKFPNGVSNESSQVLSYNNWLVECRSK